MSRSETESKSTGKESKLQIVERGDGWLKVQHPQGENICTIEDTFADTYHAFVMSHSVFGLNSSFLCLAFNSPYAVNWDAF